MMCPSCYIISKAIISNDLLLVMLTLIIFKAEVIFARFFLLYHFHLFVRSKSLSLAHTQGEGD